jgi:hypothetical protein
VTSALLPDDADAAPIPAHGPVRLVLAADVLFELAVGATLLLLRDDAARWFGIPQAAVVAIGAIFLVTAVPIAALALQRTPDRNLVRGLASANVAGGIAGWIVFALAFGHLEPAGRWLLAAASDTAILIGAGELLALRRTR